MLADNLHKEKVIYKEVQHEWIILQLFCNYNVFIWWASGVLGLIANELCPLVDNEIPMEIVVRNKLVRICAI